MAKAIRLVNNDLDKHYEYVAKLNNKIRSELSKYDNVYINSPDDALPYILNISVLKVKPEVMQHALEMNDVYVSTQTACSNSSAMSPGVFALTNDQERAKSSIRISLSYKTTEEEVDEFLKIFDKCYNKLTNIKDN